MPKTITTAKIPTPYRVPADHVRELREIQRVVRRIGDLAGVGDVIDEAVVEDDGEKSERARLAVVELLPILRGLAEGAADRLGATATAIELGQQGGVR